MARWDGSFYDILKGYVETPVASIFQITVVALKQSHNLEGLYV